jgi:hypothetical protein
LPSENENPDELDRAIRREGERHLEEFTRGLTEELITRLRETAQADPKSPWLRHMLLAGRKAVT